MLARVMSNGALTGKLPVANATAERSATQRTKRRGPNKTEAAYAQNLEISKRFGFIRNWWFESIRLKVGEDCWWTMDFLVQLADGSFVIHDTKGTKRLKNGKTKPYAEEDAIVKARSIAAQFPFPVFFVWKEKSGEWSERRM